MSSFLLSKDLEVEMLSHMVGECFIRNFYSFPLELVPPMDVNSPVSTFFPTCGGLHIFP